MNHATNRKLFKELLAEVGEGARAKLAAESKCGISTINRLCGSTYPNRPREPLRERICEGFGVLLGRKISEKELFPPVAPGASRAS